MIPKSVSASSGACRAARTGCGVGAGIDLLTELRDDRIGPLREMPIEGPDADPGLLRDLTHWGVDTRCREDRQGGFEKDLKVAPRVRPDETSQMLRNRSFVFIQFFSAHNSPCREQIKLAGVGDTAKRGLAAALQNGDPPVMAYLPTSRSG